MNQYQSQRKLPTNFIAIAASVLIAGSGYMLFSVRYGKPIREANRTASRMDSLERDLPGMIKVSLDSEVSDISSGIRSEFGSRLARVEATNESLNGKVILLEQEIANLRLMIQQGTVGMPLAANNQPAAAVSSGTQTGTQGTTVSAGSSDVNQPVSQPSDANKYLGTAQQGDIRVNIVSARVAGSQVVVEILVTKVTSGDGFFSIASFSSSVRRMVTADGLELSRLSVGYPGGSTSGSVKVDLIAGTPMRVMLYFRGQLPSAPFLARRIEFTAYEDRPRKLPLQFQFDNIVVSK